MVKEPILFVTFRHPPWSDHLNAFINYVIQRKRENVMAAYYDNLFAFTKKVIVYGDHNVRDFSRLKGKNVIFLDDTPLVDCNGIKNYMREWTFIPSSNFVKEILENCNVKNITEVIPKPFYFPPIEIPEEKEYELLVNLSQPERKGHEKVRSILEKLDKDNYKLKVLAITPFQIKHFFEGFKNIQVKWRESLKLDYEEHLKQIARCRINLFSSYVEGIGLPAIESALMKQQLVMGDISATNEFVDIKTARIVEYKLVKHSIWNNYFMFQIWDENEFLDLTVKAIKDPKFNIPILKRKEMLDFDYIWKKVSEFL